MTMNFENTSDIAESVIVHHFIISDLEYMYLDVNQDPYRDKMDAFWKTELGHWITERSNSTTVVRCPLDFRNVHGYTTYKVIAKLSGSDKTWFLLKWGKHGRF